MLTVTTTAKEKFKEALVKKYGQPSEETTNWRNETYKNHRKKWGLALSLGHVEYDSKWETQNTKIECSLKELNHYVLCLIEYWSIEYSQLLEMVQEDEKPDEIKKSVKMDPL